MPSSSLFRFGGVTFDAASGELASAGKVTRLQPQVAALLVVLLEHAGTVVTRSELQTRLWPDTTVEFDEGINFCVRQLRLALGDDSSAPRFIETLPKRGYRFLAPVTTDAARDEPGPQVSAPPPARAATSIPVTGSRSMRIILLSGAALALVIGLTALARGHWLARAVTPAHDFVVLEVLPFAADTTDSMVVAYRRRLTDQILSDARTEQGWQIVTQMSPGATHTLSGSLTRQGNSVRIFAEVVLAGTRQHLWADDITDSYAFSGNSTVTAGRIEQSVARVLGVRH
jgi:DNA-binding winged helix-turn-helix (wHTH) protein